MRTRLPFIGLLFAIVIEASAVGFISTNEYRVAAGETVTDEQWVLADTAETEGLHKNDLFIGGGTSLTLNGIYEGNVWGLARGDTILGGRCERNVRLAGKTVRIDGAVEGNLMAMAETIIVTTNAVVGGNAKLVGTSIIQEGRIAGDASITAARVATLGGTIGGRAEVYAPDILFSRGAAVRGDLTYAADKELLPPEGMVGGRLARVVPERPPLFSADRLISQAMWFFAAFLVGVPFIAFFPMTTAMAAQLTKNAPWKCLLTGFLAFIALPVTGFMCVFSIIGLPLGTLILALWAAMLYLSRIIVGLVLGTLILRSAGTSIGRVLLAMATGLAIIYFTAMVPAIGLSIQIAVAWMGMGALILALLQKRRMIIQVPDELKKLEELKQQSNQKEEQP
jgi:cytoskeletal protein CcmA (bactofilin family)